MHDRKAKAMNDTSSPSVADGTDKKPPAEKTAGGIL